jgi:hypothetical protein
MRTTMARTGSRALWLPLGLGLLLLAYALLRLLVIPVHAMLGDVASGSCVRPVQFLLSRTPNVATAAICGPALHDAVAEVVITGALGVVALLGFVLLTLGVTARGSTSADGALQ